MREGIERAAQNLLHNLLLKTPPPCSVPTLLCPPSALRPLCSVPRLWKRAEQARRLGRLGLDLFQNARIASRWTVAIELYLKVSDCRRRGPRSKGACRTTVDTRGIARVRAAVVGDVVRPVAPHLDHSVRRQRAHVIRQKADKRLQS